MKGGTIGRLWARYLSLKEELEQPSGDQQTDSGSEAGRKPALERQRKQIRDRLLVNYSPLVKYVSGRVAARATSATEMEDMISWGIPGLMDAIETYDPGRATKFETYAISKIRWAILDELRRVDWVPRRIRVRAQEFERAMTHLAQSLGRAPTEKEIVDEMGLTLEEYRNFRNLYSRAQMASLEARLDSEGSGGGGIQAIVSDRAAEDPQKVADSRALKEQLTQAIADLEERERMVATFYFYEGLTLKEIGKALGLTEGRISQILRRAMDKLRLSIGEGASI